MREEEGEGKDSCMLPGGRMCTGTFDFVLLCFVLFCFFKAFKGWEFGGWEQS